MNRKTGFVNYNIFLKESYCLNESSIKASSILARTTGGMVTTW